MTDLHTAVTQFSEAYTASKTATSNLKTKQDAFFDAIDTEISKGSLPQQIIDLPIGENPDLYVRKHYPGWLFVSIKAGQALIEQDPKLMKYAYVNHDDGKVYGRTTAQSGPSLDDEKLRQENPDLWESLTEWPEPWYSLVANTVRSMSHLHWSDDVVYSKADMLLRSYKVQRVLRGDFDLNAVEPYLIPSPITVRLVPPREAKPEELESE